jgi:imidazoleglycerol-phosphate dehydratase
VEHFFQSLANTSGMTSYQKGMYLVFNLPKGMSLHVYVFSLERQVCSGLQLAGKNSHHIVEACFKAFARALRKAVEYDTRRMGSIPRWVRETVLLYELKWKAYIYFCIESC